MLATGLVPMSIGRKGFRRDVELLRYIGEHRSGRDVARFQRTARPSHSEQEHRETEPGGIAATAADNFHVVAGQRIVPRNLALIERRAIMPRPDFRAHQSPSRHASRSEEHTSELPSLMRISYAVFCLKKKKTLPQHHPTTT